MDKLPPFLRLSMADTAIMFLLLFVAALFVLTFFSPELLTFLQPHASGPRHLRHRRAKHRRHHRVHGRDEN